MRIVTVAALIVLSLTGCANKQVVYVKPGAGTVEFEQAKATCRYQAVSATANGGNYGMRTSIGAAIAQGQKQDELIDLCLKAAGWYPTVVPIAGR